MEQHFSLNKKIRVALTQELETLSLEQLNHVPPTHNNNIFWNIAHCIAVQQALCYGLSGLTWRVEKAIVKGYRKGTQPEGPVDQAMIDHTKGLLLSSLEELERDWQAGKFETYTPYTVGLGIHLTNVEEAIVFNNIHEGIHYGYILALKKLL